MWGFSKRPKRRPSERYLALITQYQQMHQIGESDGGAELFSGYTVMKHATMLKRVFDILMPQSILDYGSGKGKAYTEPDGLELDDGRTIDLSTYLHVSNVAYYDPAYEPYSQVPSGRFDGVICTDVLEHCPEEDLDWILDEMFGFAREFVFLTIAGYPAMKHLPNGENAHITLKPAEWWNEKLNATLSNHAGLRFFAVYDADRPIGRAQSILRGKNIR